MNIGAVHSYLAGLLEGIAVTDPVPRSIVKVWPYIPPARATVADMATAMLTWDLVEVTFGSAFLKQQYEVRLQLFAAKASVDGDIGAAIASSFMPPLVNLLTQHQRLGGNVAVINGFRGTTQGHGTLVRLEWAGVGYLGLDLTIPITLMDTKENAA